MSPEMIHALLIVIIKVSIVYWLMLLGLKVLGRRAFGQIGPHEFILLMFLGKVMSDEIVTKQTGLMGNLVAGGILMIYVWLIDRIHSVKQFIQGEPIILMKNQHLDELALKRNNITQDDLNHLARKHGYSSYDVFRDIFMERNGHLSGVFKPNLVRNS